MDTESLINDFAIRCFRNTADADYLLARAAFRYNLRPAGAMGKFAGDREVFEVYSPAAQNSGEEGSSLLKRGPGYSFFIK